ncbi:MAG: hypothetical protein ACYDBV_11830 [Nitrospiria bacterium]
MIFNLNNLFSVSAGNFLSSFPGEQGEREGEASAGFAGEGGDASPYDKRILNDLIDLLSSTTNP